MSDTKKTVAADKLEAENGAPAIYAFFCPQCGRREGRYKLGPTSCVYCKAHFELTEAAPVPA